MAFFSLTKLSDWLKGRQQGITRNYKKHLSRKLPVTDWLPNYNLNFAISDLIAGLTVGLTVIPQVSRPMRARDRVTWPPYSPLIGPGYRLCHRGRAAAPVRPLLGLHGLLRVLRVRQLQGHHHRAHRHHGAHDQRARTGDLLKLATAVNIYNIYNIYSVRATVRGAAHLPFRDHHPTVRPPPGLHIYYLYTHNIYKHTIYNIYNMILLQLGFLIDFISVPVIAGFTSAAALTIASGQVLLLLLSSLLSFT